MKALNIAVLVAIILILLWTFPALTSSLKRAAPVAVLIGGALVAGALLVDSPARFVIGGGIIADDTNRDDENVVINNKNVVSENVVNDIDDIEDLENVAVDENIDTKNIAGELERLMGGDIED